ncbi:MAG: hypothetical protein AB2A00_25510 [Myxococcota bacterium]
MCAADLPNGDGCNNPANTCNGGGTLQCDGAGACLRTDGQACSVDGDCLSGACADGYCCNNACNGTCEACNVAGSEGVCSLVASGRTDGACSGTLVCDGTGNCLGVVGRACTLDGDCITGNCVDGYCCTNACSGTCQACNLAGAEGTCSNVPSGGGDGTCVGALACDGNGACVSENGQACSVGGDCLSGNCVDGVCCNTACTGTCLACNVAGSVGTCANVPANQQDNTCNLASQACDGAGHCRTLNGQACGLGSECLSGNCVDGVCCNAACTGTCQACSAAKKGSGADGVCGNISNATDPDNECPSTVTCNGAGACGYFGNGTACSLSAQCISGNCVDGVCCNTACTGVCQACNTAKKGSGADGVCGNISNATDPDNECPGTATCNGAGACGF